MSLHHWLKVTSLSTSTPYLPAHLHLGHWITIQFEWRQSNRRAECRNGRFILYHFNQADCISLADRLSITVSKIIPPKGWERSRSFQPCLDKRGGRLRWGGLVSTSIVYVFGRVKEVYNPSRRERERDIRAEPLCRQNQNMERRHTY